MMQNNEYVSKKMGRELDLCGKYSINKNYMWKIIKQEYSRTHSFSNIVTGIYKK